MDERVWDVVVVGGGPAGAATAMTLARAGRRVLMLEKQTDFGFKLGESLPPIAMGIVEHFLGPLGVDDEFRGGVAKSVGNISSWAGEGEDVADFYFTAPGFGLCLDRARFDQALRTRALADGVEIASGAQFNGCRRNADGEGWRVAVSHDGDDTSVADRYLVARYLVDCSGRAAVVAKALGVERRRLDGLFAFGRRFVSQQADDDRFTRIEAVDGGWWYSNRLPSPQPGVSERIVVFHTDRDLPQAAEAAQAQGFMALLAETRFISARISGGDYQPQGKVMGASAADERLQHFAGDGWLAVGDAAQAFDPLSSQGVHKALTSASLAGQMIDYALAEGDNRECAAQYIQRYIHDQEQRWSTYQKQHDYYYQSRPSRPDQPFWNRRREAVTVSRKIQ